VILVVVEHDRGVLAPATLEALTFARRLGDDVQALTIGDSADSLVDSLSAFGAGVVHQAHHELFTDYGPEAWGETVAQAVRSLAPSVVLATGTDRGNEVLAQAAARLDVPFVANCVEATPGDDWQLVRVRWGGSLLEECTLSADVKLLTVAHHAVEPAEASSASRVEPSISELCPDLDPSFARSRVVERVERATGVTLSTAPVVVGGGRGVGSAEGFAPLEELAALLGGVVGCSRAVTNNGWRNHTDQVGQTGTRIAPDIYLACGISGAIQHWVGAMASKKILAINTDRDANMVTKADYAVIGDLHQVVPAISAEIRRRRAG
jgi:electron transfer flavoprotein alpha subunit